MLTMANINKKAQIHQILYTPKTANNVLKTQIDIKGVDIPIKRLIPISCFLAVQKEITKKLHSKKIKINKH